MHERVSGGTRLEICAPVNLFPRDKRAQAYILIAGGVGITPFLASFYELTQAGEPFELHYAVRDTTHAGCAHRIARLWSAHIKVHVESENARPDPAKILASRALFVCRVREGIDEATRNRQHLAMTNDCRQDARLFLVQRHQDLARIVHAFLDPLTVPPTDIGVCHLGVGVP